jgi:hypothetical protein
MDRLSRAIARLVTAMIISFGVQPPVVAALELLRRPSARLVLLTRQRAPEYAKLFIEDTGSQPSDTDEGLGQSVPTEIRRAESRNYTPVQTA